MNRFSDRHNALIAVLVEARQGKRLTQRQLSAKLKRGRGFIQRVENGERVLDFLEVIDVAEVLGIDPFDLLDRILNHGQPGPAIDPIVVSAKPKAKAKSKKKRRR